ncbi:SNF2 family N-terminal domain-containing protein [Camillea tinctor]|nr:SNF2 family N-terminal domain-containing protein [Camillea tinctor]
MASNEGRDLDKVPKTNENEMHPEDSGADCDYEGIATDALDEASALQHLTANVRDQEDLERDISYQANLAFIEAEDKKDEKRIEKAQANIIKLEAQKKVQQEKFRKAIGKSELKQKIRDEIARIDSEIDIADKDIADFHARIEQRHQDGGHAGQVQGGSRKLPNESHRDFLIRTGKITPFSNIGGPSVEGVGGTLADALGEAEDEAELKELEAQAGYEPQSHQNLRAPGFAEEQEKEQDEAIVSVESEFSLRSRKKRRIQKDVSSDDEYTPQASDAPEADFIDDQEVSDDIDLTKRPRKKAKRAAKKASKKSQDEETQDMSRIDDGDEANYQARLADWVDRRSRARLRRQQKDGGEAAERPGNTNDKDEEWFKPSPDQPDHTFSSGLRLPGDIYPALFDYQKTGVQWLSELYSQHTGGIIGDEMGLGKTVQIISFIAALHYSKHLKKPVIVVAPGTVLRQWVNEFHRWWPPLRVSILHSSGSGMFNVTEEDTMADEDLAWGEQTEPKARKSKAAKNIVDRVVNNGHVLVTTYAGLQTYGKLLIPVQWGYAILDEGHKIRNPNSAITIYCKELRTPNRVILSGTPMQNNLMELWSLFDFVHPMKLGTLIEFRNKFEIPIKQGGYANASNLQIMTAHKCAETLKDSISRHILQRLKADVAADLPKKSEQVLFCRLTRTQQEAYEEFLKSNEMSDIFNRTRQSLYGIDILRKICNHPDLVNTRMKSRPGYRWGLPNKSGKMQVVKALLQMWKKLGHKTLLFSQGVQMLDILEDLVRSEEGIRYIRMDGSTAIKDRQTLVDRFNSDPDIDLFLLTTKVGGLGVNLTGANRVIIFDPDWNPSTDIQARERAWRLGQKKDVTIYRLMTAGTIEEKIYHRQIYKQFLSNKVLRDPSQRAAFRPNDLHDLFTLGSPDDDVTETGKLFRGSEIKINKSPTEHESTAPNLQASETQGASKGESGASQGDKPQDLSKIAGVASLEDYEPDPQTQPAANEEDRLMEGLFARSGLHSALEHDAIMNGSSKTQASRRILQQDADQVAAEAAALLRRSAAQSQNIPIGTVTWTGEVGEGGRPANIRRGAGPGSAGILNGLANRQGLNGGDGNASPRPAPSSSRRAPKDFDSLVRDFIRRHGGRAPSKLLIDHFGPQCAGSSETAAFKASLHRVAVMESKGGSRLRAIWTLKK